jgi:hypothetical protein
VLTTRRKFSHFSLWSQKIKYFFLPCCMKYRHGHSTADITTQPKRILYKIIAIRFACARLRCYVSGWVTMSILHTVNAIKLINDNSYKTIKPTAYRATCGQQWTIYICVLFCHSLSFTKTTIPRYFAFFPLKYRIL